MLDLGKPVAGILAVDECGKVVKQGVIMPAMEVPIDAHDLLPPRVPASQTDGEQCRFTARVDVAYLFRAGDMLDNLFSKFCRQWMIELGEEADIENPPHRF